MKVGPIAVLSGAASLATYFLHINPSLLDGKTWEIVEFSIHNFAITITVIAVLVFLASAMSVAPGLRVLVDFRIHGVRKTLKEEFERSPVILIFAACLSLLLLYEAAFLARNAYTFYRDAFWPLYRAEIYARGTIKHRIGDLAGAKEDFRLFQTKFAGSTLADGWAQERLDVIESELGVKNYLVSQSISDRKSMG